MVNGYRAVLGNVGCISCNGNKIITGSSGEFLLTDDLEAANKVKKWSTQSRENAEQYQLEEIGYNYRMINIITRMICGQIPYLQEHIATKKAIWERYKEELKGLPVSMNSINFEKYEPNYSDRNSGSHYKYQCTGQANLEANAYAANVQDESFCYKRR